MRATLCAILLIFLGLPVPVFGATVSMPDADLSAGETVEVPVMIDNAAGVAGFQFTLSYDPSALQAVGAVAGELTSGWMVKANTATSGQLSVAGVDSSLKGLGSVKGSLAKMQFKAVSKKSDRSKVSFSVCKLSDSGGAKIAATCTAGQIRVTAAGKPKPDKH